MALYAACSLIYISTVTLHGGPVVLRPVRATPCFSLVNQFGWSLFIDRLVGCMIITAISPTGVLHVHIERVCRPGRIKSRPEL